MRSPGTRKASGCALCSIAALSTAGVRWVIDYKTSQHLGSGIEQFLDREVERYRPQLQRYGQLARRLGPEPVRLGLYFPLMGAWREWAAEEEVD